AFDAREDQTPDSRRGGHRSGEGRGGSFGGGARVGARCTRKGAAGPTPVVGFVVASPRGGADDVEPRPQSCDARPSIGPIERLITMIATMRASNMITRRMFRQGKS